MSDPNWNDGEIGAALADAAFMAALTARYAEDSLDLVRLDAPELGQDGRDLLLFAISHTRYLAENAKELFEAKLRLHLDDLRKSR